jgi:hypothetical protein
MPGGGADPVRRTFPALVLTLFLALFLALSFGSALPAFADTVWVGRFTADETAASAIPAPWALQQLDAKVAPTRYALRTWDGVHAIEAHAKKSMALLGRPLEIDLDRTPILCWQWRVDAPLVSADMARKAGDDYAARVYVSFAIPPAQMSFGTRTKLSIARSIWGDQVPDAALNYVWDNKHPVGTLADNAYTDRTRMWVLRSGAGEAGRWVRERRDLRADFRRAFVELDGRLTGIAVAADTDNTGEEAHAGFADFRFVAAEADCPPP